MEILNIFTVEKLIFLNPKAKRVLWKEFPKFFKEYILLKQAGVDSALFNKLYMKFFEKFAEKDFEQYLEEIFGSRLINFNYNFKKIIVNVNFKFKEVCVKFNYFNKVNLKYSNLKLINLTENSTNIHEISRQYPNMVCTRDKENLKITFWR